MFRFQQRAEDLDRVERSMDEYPVDDGNETLMVNGVRDDPLIRMRLVYPEMQCELHLHPGESTPATGVVGPSSRVLE